MIKQTANIDKLLPNIRHQLGASEHKQRWFKISFSKEVITSRDARQGQRPHA